MVNEESVEDNSLNDYFEDEVVEINTEKVDEVNDTSESTEESSHEVKGEIENTDNKEVSSNESTPPVDKKPTMVPVAALHDERRKAHHLKEENESLKRQIPKSEEAPDPYEDIDAYNAHMRAKWTQENQAEQAAKNSQRIESMRGQMLEKHDDFIEMENIFGVMMAKDQTLMGKMLESGNEVQFAYNAATEYKKSLLGGVQAPTETQAPVELDERTKSAIEAPNLATATAQASNSVQAEKAVEIDDIFEDQVY